MAGGLQVLGLLLAASSWCLCWSSASSQVWRTRSSPVGGGHRQSDGLWTSCSSTQGSQHCNTYSTSLGLPAHLQACRALMILALMVGLTAIITAVLGLKCTKIGTTSEQTKDKMAVSGGILFILAGVFILVAVSWYASRVIQDFYDPAYGGLRFELGSGLYLGFVSSGLSLLGGALLCCSYRKTPPPRHFSYNFSATPHGHSIYRPPSSSSTKEYV